MLLDQREPRASAASADDEGVIGFAILRETAALVSARGGASQACQTGGRCPNQAGVKQADSLAASARVCLPHAEEILVTVPAAFIASHDDCGLAALLAGRRHPDRPDLRGLWPART